MALPLGAAWVAIPRAWASWPASASSASSWPSAPSSSTTATTPSTPARTRGSSSRAAGLSVHSFIDGLGIGLAFGLDTATGILVFVAVVAHDFATRLANV